MRVATVTDTLRPRSAEAPLAASLLSLAVHLGLIAALMLGVSWRISQPLGAQAELWSAVPQAADAPRPAPPPPQAQPQVQPVKPVTQPPRPAPQPERIEPQADIAVQKTPPKPRVTPPKEPPPVKPSKPLAAAATKPTAAAKPPAPAERESVLKSDLDDWQAKLKRELAGSSTSGGTGKQAQATGPSASYAARIRARIKPNITFPDVLMGNPEAVISVVCDAGGRIMSQRLIKSSGVPAWDAAVQRAIERAEVLPVNEDGVMPSPLELSFRPRDF